MPTYEYECQNCGHRMEKFQSITARAIRKCPECKKHKLQRLLGTGGGLIFKGPGFYATDYRSPAARAAHAEEQSAKSSTEDKPAPEPAK